MACGVTFYHNMYLYQLETCTLMYRLVCDFHVSTWDTSSVVNIEVSKRSLEYCFVYIYIYIYIYILVVSLASLFDIVGNMF